ncbi:MAG: hypothetical protein PHP20_11010 [Firmicutes bacterium]|jgi:hypothetical protein|nr:hypothetical protein [Bacillota bacterium]MDD4336647.1 hypothetical protein [Bacillota bacterium]MDD4793577.1 hypothetical protein [Bacillota bacterium]
MPTKEEIRDALAGRLPKRGCPACGGKTWDIQPDIFMSSLYSPDLRRIDTARGAPMVTAVCVSCGFFLNYGAVRLGLIDPDARDK